MGNYQRIAEMNKEHHVFLVQDSETKKIYAEKEQSTYNIGVYEQLLKNPVNGTPQIIEFEEKNDQLILVEEYIGGRTIQELIDEQSLTGEQIRKYCALLCDTMIALHSMNPPIIHRCICYADGKDCQMSYFRDDAISATLSAGRKAKGTVTFSVPDDASVVEVEYVSNYWTSERVIFAVSE